MVGRCYTSVGRYSSNMADCERGTNHGTAVAEAIVDVAPGVELYISNPTSLADEYLNTVQWMADQGVSVINRSASRRVFEGPGDGTSPYSNSIFEGISYAVDNGIVWVNSAGNFAERHWWTSSPSTSANGLVYFGGSDAFNNVFLEAGDEIYIAVRWDDSWGGASRDLDVCIFSVANILNEVCSRDLQNGSQGAYPVEYISAEILSSGFFAIEITHYSGNLPTWVQLRVGGANLEHSTARHSINNASESAKEGMLAVGATHYWNTRQIAEYSSQGPTPDGRLKPDIVGTACAASASYPQRTRNGRLCWFSGTSQAAPHVAGLAALVKQANPSFTPEQVADYLKNNAVDRGTSGADNTWGYGFAQLPSPPPFPPTQQPPGTPSTDTCVSDIAADSAVTGTWAEGCRSQHPVTSQHQNIGYARYYSFTTDEARDVTITLKSTVDSFLYLRSGDSRSGAKVAENDDHGRLLNNAVACASAAGLESTDSCITLNGLPAGDYTIEATTYDAAKTGTFTLTVSGLAGTTTGPGPGPGADTCGEDITTDGTVNGTWAADCRSQHAVSSQHPNIGYARYYSIELAQESEVTITLESDVDTYLYLREGDARSGTARHSNDDHGNAGLGRTTDSQIKETLPAGDYTIEATTYVAATAGSFTLTVSGLAGTTTGPGPGPGADTCGESIDADGTVNGTWAAGCQSAESGRGYARYYSFTTDEARDVTITVKSDVDAYLYLRSGDRTGSVTGENDDHGTLKNTVACASAAGLGDRDSCITYPGLPAGDYTIEATTYATATAGSFTLTVSGLAGTTTGPGPGPGADTCGDSIDADGTVSGTWAAGCQSQHAVSSKHPNIGYARYYSIELAQESEVTITLESEVDTYLYLREGDARSGGFLHENDDHDNAGLSKTTDSQIKQTLPAGKYTIEATTYVAATAGSFTLTVSGLSGTTAGPGPGPGADTCGESIDADETVNGTWAAGCQSAESGRGYARYYSFTTDEARDVTITVKSTVDSFLYLRSGDSRSGAKVGENDDHERLLNNAAACASAAGLGTTDSCITITDLPAGDYTIEATTYATATAGSFTLTVSGLAGTTTGPGPGPNADTCSTDITADGTVNGTWAADCRSQVTTPNTNNYGYARYYSFTLAEQRDVTFTVNSTVDSYMHLRAGTSRSGAAVAENDDHGRPLNNAEACATPSGLGERDSCITVTGLSADEYTLEVTTYNPNEAGTFTLAVSGLGSP